MAISDPRDEVQVIDDELLVSAIRSEGLISGEWTASSLAEIALSVPQLKLSFKNILEIDNLQGFNHLRKLCLDNNILKKIENLDHLDQLEWLDLSFNNIEKISGLEKLTKLTDLSLFNNRITDIDHLDKCLDLQCLSLGNNKITALDSIVKLRVFKQLRLLNLEGNPVSKEGEYRMYVLAYLNDLTYLDYSMVLKSETVAAREQYQDELLDVEEKESLELEKCARDIAAKKHTAELTKANLAFVETIFDDMFADDAEMAKLKKLPGVTDVYNSFQSEVESASDTFLQAGLAKDKQKNEDVTSFDQRLTELREKYTQDSITEIEAFAKFKKHQLRDIAKRQASDMFPDTVPDTKEESPVVSTAQLSGPLEPSDVEPISKKLEELYETLMDFEMYQQEKFEQYMNDFEVKYAELKDAALEGQQGYFRVLEDHESTYTKEVMQLVTDLVEKASKDELSGFDVDDDAAALLDDRDACLNAVTGSHDVHVGKLFKVEDEAKNNEELHCKDLIKRYRDDEHKRNRDRIYEIMTYKDSVQQELNDLLNRDLDADGLDGADGPE